jgi:hypothetical protein
MGQDGVGAELNQLQGVLIVLNYLKDVKLFHCQDVRNFFQRHPEYLREEMEVLSGKITGWQRLQMEDFVYEGFSRLDVIQFWHLTGFD